MKYHTFQYSLDDCSRMLLSLFYVDNLIKIDNPEAELSQLYSKGVERMQEGVSLSNHATLTLVLREQMKWDNTSVLHGCQWEKVLEYRYDPQTDSFRLVYQDCNPKMNTKRGILSHAFLVFDPLLLCLQVSIQSRILMRELWRGGLDWDNVIPAD